jgi:5-methyltetrahydrofolate--homocysteine methyltransferase
MIIIGEKINTSRKEVSEAVSTGNRGAIVEIARQQVAAGARYIDANAGTFVDKEIEYLTWLVRTIQEAVDIPLCLDSPNPKAISRAMEVHRGVPMINSISLEPDRFDDLYSVITKKPCKVVALCMAEASMPTTTEERVAVAKELVGKLLEGGISIENIFVDPLIQPVAVDQGMGLASLNAISAILDLFPGVNTVCGLSNISYGLPMRRLINRHFFTLAIAHGLTAAILDPTDTQLMSSLFTTEMLLGKDEYCADFIDAYQNGILSEVYKIT